MGGELLVLDTNKLYLMYMYIFNYVIKNIYKHSLTIIMHYIQEKGTLYNFLSSSKNNRDKNIL